ncbi:unnamed protein product [Dovyalis caffra]|uniref:BHLH domain-containing protein n=1 Tax=Dovyalis caffra TaxID=77055 RepID=A0AAV1RVQ6_9ROSI|nr:unnamed protein product [Dovyalis caffra]
MDFEGKRRRQESFWTVCPYCYYMYEYEGLYEDCCLRCQNQNCNRAFHGVSMPQPSADMLVQGKDQYYFFSPTTMHMGMGPNPTTKEDDHQAATHVHNAVVEISSDDDDDDASFSTVEEEKGKKNKNGDKDIIDDDAFGRRKTKWCNWYQYWEEDHEDGSSSSSSSSSSDGLEFLSDGDDQGITSTEGKLVMALQQIYDMQHLSSYNTTETCSNQDDFRQALLNSINETAYNKSLAKPLISEDDSKLIAAKKHSMAESNRRSRINSQFAALRTILPNLIKVNKASVLEETIRCVKELTNTVSELKSRYGGGRLECVFPGGADKLRIDSCEGRGQEVVKVAFSCDDKRKLMSDVARAVRSVKGKVVRAEMVTMGGRTECVLWVQGINGNDELKMLRRVLNAATEKSNMWRTCNRAKLTM